LNAPPSRPEQIKAAAARPLETPLVFLVRIDPAKNVNRLYMVAVTPRLFGECLLRRERGHIGSPGTVQSRKLRDERAAGRAALHQAAGATRL
jgi:predicted DNA-binding WGR domain protein